MNRLFSMRHDGENHFSSCFFLQSLGKSGNGGAFYPRWKPLRCSESNYRRVLDSRWILIVGSSPQRSTGGFLPHAAPLLKEEWNLRCLALFANREHPPSFIGRAPGPLSPPTMTQEMPSSGIFPRSSRSGSIDRKRTAAGDACKSAILGKPYSRSSTDTPHQMCASFAASCKGPQST